MGENSDLCGILETMKNHFHMRILDLSLHSTQRTRILLLKHRLLDIFLLKGLITLLKKNIMHYATKG